MGYGLGTFVPVCRIER